MADERINPEAAVKFFVGLASAGIGFAAVFAEKCALPKGTFSVGFIVFVLLSLVCFVGCLLLAIFFYYDAMNLGEGVLDQDKEQKRAGHCGEFCLGGVLLLGMAVFCLLLLRFR